MCGLSQEKKRYQARWVYPKFIINLPSEIWKVSEVHHGALLKKPLLIYISYFPPSHFIWKKEGWPSSTVWMLDCYTPTASVAVGVDKTFLFDLFSGPTPRIHPRSGRDLAALGAGWFQCQHFLQAARHQNHPVNSTAAMTFPSLSVQKLVMHSWNWFETHFVACWCCMEKSQKKFTW